MRLVLHRESRTRAARRTTSLALVSALVLLALGAATANASPASSATVSSFCGLAHGVEKTALNPSSGLTPAAAKTTSLATMESNLKTEFAKFEAAEPALVGAAPSQIKGDLKQVFTVDNALFQDLKNAHWNFMALATDQKSLLAEEAKIKVPLAALEAYFKGTCGIKEP